MSLNHLKVKLKNSSLELLKKYQEMFDETLGKYIGSDFNIELKEDAEPYQAKPFPIAKIHKPSLKKEVD